MLVILDPLQAIFMQEEQVVMHADRFVYIITYRAQREMNIFELSKGVK